MLVYVTEVNYVCGSLGYLVGDHSNFDCYSVGHCIADIAFVMMVLEPCLMWLI